MQKSTNFFSYFLEKNSRGIQFETLINRIYKNFCKKLYNLQEKKEENYINFSIIYELKRYFVKKKILIIQYLSKKKRKKNPFVLRKQRL